MTPVFHPEAEQEVAAALKVGEERGFGLGRELIQEIRRVSALLCFAMCRILGSRLIRATVAFRCVNFRLVLSIALTETCSESQRLRTVASALDIGVFASNL
jgi:hypothetical protein